MCNKQVKEKNKKEQLMKCLSLEDVLFLLNILVSSMQKKTGEKNPQFKKNFLNF